MSEIEPVRVEHHYHDPTTSQVFKAVRQYLTEKFPADQLNQLIDKKIADAVNERIGSYLRGDAFNNLCVNTVAQVIAGEKAVFEKGTYGMHNRLRDLALNELQKQLVSAYEVRVEKR